jgi:hypothetical protein
VLGFKFQLPQLESYSELTGGGGTRNLKNVVKSLPPGRAFAFWNPIEIFT